MFKKKGNVFNNLHLFCGNIADAIIKYSLIKLSGDNVTCIFIAFNNFKNEMEKNDFEYYDQKIDCQYIGDEIDLSKSE
jgi:hypothetical protein